MATVGTAPVGVLIPTTTKPEELADFAQFVESHGFSEVWIAEDYFFYGGSAAAGMVLEATDHVTVGIGVLSAVVRHPAVTAMEIATLARAHPGRLLPAIGHGVPAWTKQMGLYPGSPLGTFREVITSIRRLLAGETLTSHDGHFVYDGVQLAHPAPDVPILGGVVGPKSLELSGEIADGTVLSVLAGTDYVSFAQERASNSANRSGRGGAHLLPTFAIFSVDDDAASARAVARSVVAFYLAAVGPTALTGVFGGNDQLDEMMSRGGQETIEREMPDDWLDKLAIAGNPAECASRIDALIEAGSTSVVLVPTPTERGRELLEVAAREVIPRLGRKQ